MGSSENPFRYARERGSLWTLLYGFRFLCLGVTRCLDRCLIRIEKRRFLTGDSTISSLDHTIDQNRNAWNTYDWSQLGDEWTLDATKYKGLDPERWRVAVIQEMMWRYIARGSTVLEIGPGAGRWTKVLQPLCGRLFLADISEKCLSMCRESFRASTNIEYYLIKDGSLRFLPDSSIDAIWSYDVFVHINPTETNRYIADFGRILKPGGYGIIHHPGAYGSRREADEDWRSHMDGRFFAQLIRTHGMALVEQNDSLPHKPGDIISVFRKPAG